MALTQVKTLGIADDAVTEAKVANDAISPTEMKAGTDGHIITYDASGNPTTVGPGTDGQVLTSTGAGSPPAFETLPTSGATLSGSTDNTVVTVTGSNAMIGEATLTYDGTNLQAKQTGNTETSIILDSNRSAADNSIGGLVGKWDTETIGDIRFLTDDDTSNKDNGYIVFRTSAASGSLNEHLRIKPAGDVQITDGNVTLANGHGIDFSATSDGGVSTPSELLDDYEEGTWTPVLKDADSGGNTYSGGGDWTTYAKYTKIGRIVHVFHSAYALADTGMTGGNGIFVHGFPFATVGTIVTSIKLTYFTGFADDEFGPYIQVNNGQTIGRLHRQHNGASASSNTPVIWDNVHTNGYFGFQYYMTYHV